MVHLCMQIYTVNRFGCLYDIYQAIFQLTDHIQIKTTGVTSNLICSIIYDKVSSRYGVVSSTCPPDSVKGHIGVSHRKTSQRLSIFLPTEESGLREGSWLLTEVNWNILIIFFKLY